MKPRIKLTADKEVFISGIGAVDVWFDSNFKDIAQLDAVDFSWLRTIDGIQGISGKKLVDRFKRLIAMSELSSGTKMLLAVKHIQQTQQYTIINSNSCGSNAAILLYNYLIDEAERGIPQYAVLYDTSHRWELPESYVFQGMLSGATGVHDLVVMEEMLTYEGR